MNLKIIKNIKFFADNFSEKFLIHLCKSLEEKKYGPEEAVFTKDSSSDKLFILNSGDLSYYIELANGNKKKSIKILETIKVNRDS
jgi:penicillin-binding protein-related factor A (putative recombinase)